MKKFLKFLPIIFIALYLLIVYEPFIFDGKLPIPADTIVGLYHPWRDYFIKQYPNGIPFKNLLVTDAVRQQYPWRQLAISELKRGSMPVWNPYSFAGYPLLANIQSAAFYPFNFLYWLTNFPLAWSLQVLLQPLLGFVFMALYLRNLRLRPEAVALGSLAWASCGFFVAWTTSNTIVQTAIWLPLALLAIDQFFESGSKLKWGLIFVISLLLSFLAGHLQTFIYVLATVGVYSVSKFLTTKKIVSLFAIFGLIVVFILLSVFVSIPIIEFIGRSAREVDQLVWQKPDWFLPWQNLIQFIAPDFFGNPATLNYFGVWNYGEFVGYIGLIPLIFSIVGIILVQSPKKIFFVLLLIGALLFTLPTPIGKIPYELKIPFLSSTQPSRLIVIVDFTLAVLSAFGFDYFLNNAKGKKISIIISVLLGICLLTLWIVAKKLSLQVSLRNLYFPTLIIGVTFIVLLASLKNKLMAVVVGLLLIVSLLDSARFATKFIPFSQKEWLFPETKTTRFLEENTKKDFSRIISVDNRIIAQNFSVNYKLQSISGYDPLYLLSYGQFMIAMNRNKPDLSLPFGFNREINPQDPKARFINLMGVKYVISFFQINNDPQFKLVLTEGDTRTYENLAVFPRTFFVSKIDNLPSQNKVLARMYEANFDPRQEAAVENADQKGSEQFSVGQAKITNYEPDSVDVLTKNSGSGFLLLTDVYYPAWKATIDGRPTEVYQADYAFRGVIVPKGTHKINFHYQYFPF